jgi:hypothetical protein
MRTHSSLTDKGRLWGAGIDILIQLLITLANHALAADRKKARPLKSVGYK